MRANENTSPVRNERPKEREVSDDAALARKALEVFKAPFADVNLKDVDRKLARISAFQGSGPNADLDLLRFVLADTVVNQLKSFIKFLIIVRLLLTLRIATALLRARAIFARFTEFLSWRCSDAWKGAMVAKLLTIS